MCDYSLMAIPNRLAASGEELVVHRFEAGTVGLASASRPKKKTRVPQGPEPRVLVEDQGLF
jgi:hypothetical protein